MNFKTEMSEIKKKLHSEVLISTSLERLEEGLLQGGGCRWCSKTSTSTKAWSDTCSLNDSKKDETDFVGKKLEK